MEKTITLSYNNIIVKGKTLLAPGALHLSSTGIILICGKNGCGKTLFLNQLQYNNPSINIQYVPQECDYILKDVCVIDNITMGNIEKENDAKQFLVSLGFSQLENRSPKTLSGGEQRIVSIGRALLSDADIILFDEPTNELQYDVISKLNNIILEYSNKKLLIIVSHDDRMQALANAVILFDNQQLHSSNDDIVSILENGEKGIQTDPVKAIHSKQLYYVVSRTWKLKIFIIFMCIYAILSAYHVKDSFQSSNNSFTLPNNQANIYFFGFSKAGDMTGGLPSTLYPLFLDAKIDNHLLKMLNSKLNSIQYVSSPEDCLLSLQNNKEVSVYYLDFYDPNSGFTYKLDSIYRELFSLPYEQYAICYDDFFLYPEYANSNDERTKISFEYDKYLICLDYITEMVGQLIPCYAVIRCNENITIRQLLTDHYFSDDIYDDTIYIHSNEGRNILQAAKSFILFRNNFHSFLYECSFFLILGFVYSCVYIKYKLRSIEILRNYGARKKDVVKAISKHISRIYYITQGIFIAFSFIMIHFINYEFQRYLLLSLVFFSSTLINQYLLVLILHISATRVYQWKYRP